MSAKSLQATAYVTPRALLAGAAAREAVAAGWAWPLLGEGAYAAMEVSTRENGSVTRLGAIVRTAYDKDASAIPQGLRASIEMQMAALASKRGAFAGFDVSKPILMGVLNVTPDSFSDGGRFDSAEAAVAHGVALFEAGAALVDVGGESTRPGAVPVGEHAEIARVVPVVKALTTRGVPVSIDTRHAAVMAEAVAAGAKVINDISALADAKSLAAAAKSGLPVVLMHMQGEPRTMQDNPTYVWAPGDIYDFLASRIAACVAAGIAKNRIAVDPGLGFGKTDDHDHGPPRHVSRPRLRACGGRITQRLHRPHEPGRGGEGPLGGLARGGPPCSRAGSANLTGSRRRRNPSGVSRRAPAFRRPWTLDIDIQSDSPSHSGDMPPFLGKNEAILIVS